LLQRASLARDIVIQLHIQLLQTKHFYSGVGHPWHASLFTSTALLPTRCCKGASHLWHGRTYCFPDTLLQCVVGRRLVAAMAQDTLGTVVLTACGSGELLHTMAPASPLL
jgi:hypothetical protein